ncbi:hypothetical protein A2U01_0070758, partial [Trifolium medium]|nr:hypothetical protein [Trifolium medium]
MMGIYCPSKLLSRFSTAIDGIIMLISGLGPALGLYILLLYEEDKYILLLSENLASHLTNLSVGAPAGTQLLGSPGELGRNNGPMLQDHK